MNVNILYCAVYIFDIKNTNTSEYIKKTFFGGKVEKSPIFFSGLNYDFPRVSNTDNI